ncbi:serine/threonine-protein kinase [bacterium]|nr:serine/threonine-protein kinase [bacterium]
MVGQSLSHYQITNELGRGGMGIVYKAMDTKLDRTVAIKVLPSAALADSDDRARFYREAKAAAQLHHPHIASVFEIDEAVPSDAPHGTQASPFIAMEYIDGESLASRIKKAPLSIKNAVDLSIQIAKALEAAHEKDIVHRDIKSANVMLTAKGEAKVLDFGLAKTTHSTMLTRMGSTLGTIAYMSPEQARGEEVDQRTDLWALGITLYEMVVGRHPYPGDYEQAVVYSILNEDPEPLTAVRTGVPMELERIVTKLLRKDAAHRYQTAGDLIADLQAMDLASTVSTSSRTAIQAPVVHDRRSKSTVWLSLALLAMTVLALVSFLMRPSPTPPLTLRSSILLGGEGGFNPGQRFQLSPDEKSLVYVSWPALDGGRLWVRNMATGEQRPLEGTEGARSPFWSPDGMHIGYLLGDKIAVVPSAGGLSQIKDTGSHVITTAAWGADGTLLFRTREGLFSVPVDGGDIFSFNVNSFGGALNQIAFHPNGVDFLIFRNPGIKPDSVYQGTIGKPDLTWVLLSQNIHFASPDWLVYFDGGTVFKRHYDVATPTDLGKPEALFKGVWIPGGTAAMSVRDRQLST